MCYLRTADLVAQALFKHRKITAISLCWVVMNKLLVHLHKLKKLLMLWERSRS